MRLLWEWTSPGLSLRSPHHRARPGLVSDLPLNSQGQVILTTQYVSESISTHQRPEPWPKLQLEKVPLSPKFKIEFARFYLPSRTKKRNPKLGMQRNNCMPFPCQSLTLSNGSVQSLPASLR